MQFAALWLLNRKFLLGVIGVVVDEEGRVLLLDHSYRKEFPWALPSGWVRRGEQPDQAMVREIREEVHLDVKDMTLLGICLDQSLPRADITFVCRPADPGARPVPADLEIRAAGFYRTGAFPDPLSEDQSGLVKEALRRLGFEPPAVH